MEVMFPVNIIDVNIINTDTSEHILSFDKLQCFIFKCDSANYSIICSPKHVFLPFTLLTYIILESFSKLV